MGFDRAPGPREATPAAPHRDAAAEAPSAVAAPAKDGGAVVVVEDGAQPGPGQLQRAQFMALVSAGARAATDEELAGSGRSAADCPYLEYWLGYYGGQSAKHLEQAVRRYAQPAADTPEAWVGAVVARVRSAVRAWRSGGEGEAGPAGGAPEPAGGGAAVQPKRADGGAGGPGNPGAVLGQLGPGRALDPGTRARMERAFGERFEDVRVHHDATGGGLAGQLSARAFTVGAHVAFAPGEHRPGTLDGDALLAHELAHVLQQRGGRAPAPAGAGPVRDGAELAADHAAAGALARLHGDALGPVEALGGRVSPVRGAGLQLQRCKKDSGPTATEVARLTRELEDVIREGTWRPSIRTRMYAALATPIEGRADERRAGRRSDLRGLGAVASVDRFAAGIRRLQADWAGLTPDERRGRVVSVAAAEMRTAGVPAFLSHSSNSMMAQASFNPGAWSFQIRAETTAAATLADADAAALADAAAHEARHAEQAFLAARLRAGEGRSAAQIASELLIPMSVAIAARAAPLGAGDADYALAQEMYRATVTDAATHAATDRRVDTEIAELDRRRVAAEGALADLRRDPSRSHYDAGVSARDALRAQIRAVEVAYQGYRDIPYERDAHEVGVSAGRAFRRGP